MAPAASRLRAEAALAQYLLLLQLYPLLTKAASSGTLLALGNVLAQMIEKMRKNEDSQNLDIGSSSQAC